MIKKSSGFGTNLALAAACAFLFLSFHCSIWDTNVAAVIAERLLDPLEITQVILHLPQKSGRKLLSCGAGN